MIQKALTLELICVMTFRLTFENPKAPNETEPLLVVRMAESTTHSADGFNWPGVGGITCVPFVTTV